MFSTVTKKFAKVPPKGLLISYKYSLSNEENGPGQLSKLQTEAIPSLQNYTESICKSSGITPELSDPIYKSALEFMEKYGPELQQIVLKNTEHLRIENEQQLREIEGENVDMDVEPSFSEIISEMVDTFVNQLKGFAQTFYEMIYGKEKKDNSKLTPIGKPMLLSVFVIVSYYGLSALVSRFTPYFTKQVESAFLKTSSSL
eukprot:gene2075-1947_t